MIYKASETAELYQWNDTTKSYERLNSGQTSLDIKIINGGNAHG